MPETKLYPLLLNPALHQRVWGGRHLETVMHKNLPTNEPYGESWEMHDTATVANGEFAGRALGDLLSVFGASLIGAGNDPKAGIPLLVKFLDATNWLSVQVHPNDEQAREQEGEPRGKSEAWYVIAAEPNAKLVIGLKPGITREEVSESIRANWLEEALVFAPVVAGDVLYIPAGTVHALGPGILVYEIQQSSDLTYRLYDWGRMGLDGKPRALHIDKGVAVAWLDRLPTIAFIGAEQDATVKVVASPYFETLLHQLRASSVALDTERRIFHTLTCIEGEVAVVTNEQPGITMRTGQTILIPAALGAYTITGTGKVLRSYQTD